MFKIGDTVTYKNEGVCSIFEIAERDFSGTRAKYYVLRPIYKETTRLYVPVDNEFLTSKMKRVLSRREIDDIIEQIKNSPAIWMTNPDDRRQYYKELVASGNKGEIFSTVIGIKKKLNSANKKEKKPHIFDLQFMKDNEKIIIEEFALALGVKPSEALEYIEKKLYD